MPQDARSNVVLIGMPGVGKSTIGVLLAKALNRNFIDSDVFIQAATGRSLQDIIDRDGCAAFLDVERRYVAELDLTNHVIATGGSVVYGDDAMRRLRRDGWIVYLAIDFPALEPRITDLDTRGLVMRPGMTLFDLYRERKSLYEKWADFTVDTNGLDHGRVLARILALPIFGPSA